MAFIKLLTNRIENPLGYCLGTSPRLSWVVEGVKGSFQKRARVEVSLDDSFSNIIFDSGMNEDMNSIAYQLLIDLAPRTRYHWRVTVETDADEIIKSDTAWFETAKMDELWTANWIKPDFDKNWHPSLFSEIKVEKTLRSARAYVCGLGVYEMFIGGTRIGEDILTPGLCAYDKWLPYQTYDITADLLTGSNIVEIHLGNGWYKGRYGFNTFTYGDEFACICEIVVEYADGTSDLFVTNDESWKARRITVTDSSINDGEWRDDTLDCSCVYPVKQADMDRSLLHEKLNSPTRIMHRLKPVEIIITPAGETVLDMGQNMTGWIEFISRAPKGHEIYLQVGEVLQEGNFYRDNLRSAKAEYHYISDGIEKTVRPRFTFYGFRYVKLTKWFGNVNADDFTGLVLHTNMERTGKITTDNEKVNRLYENALWSQRCNFLDVPTDCPQRDERMGWTGDAQVFFGTAAYNMDVYAFFTKYCYDLLIEQQAYDGAVPVIIPNHGLNRFDACAWGDAATIIPWEMYIRYGDKAILEQQYPSMKAWVDHVKSLDDSAGGKRLWRGDFHYGDWLALDNEDPINNRLGGTEHTYLASCFYRHSARLAAKAAKVLGLNDDAEYYANLSDEVRGAIVREYVTGSGRLAIPTQTAHILALYMDIIPECWREKTAVSLRRKLKETGCHLRTGFIGTPYLCRVLSNNGSNDISYRLLLNEDYPGWLYEVNMGATTIWERWNSIMPDGKISDTGMNSLNHYAYGSIVEWMYRDVAGINPIEEHPGFKRFRLAPKPDQRLGCVKAEYRSPYGLIRSEWQYIDDELELKFTVPFGSEAELTLPDCDGTYPEFQILIAGEYVFHYTPASRKQPKLNFETPVGELLKHPDVKEFLIKEAAVVVAPQIQEFLALEMSISDFIVEGYLKLDADKEAILRARLAEVK